MDNCYLCSANQNAKSMANDKDKIYEQIYFLWKGEGEKRNESIDWYCEKYHVKVEDFRRWYKGISKSVKEVQVIGRPENTSTLAAGDTTSTVVYHYRKNSESITSNKDISYIDSLFDIASEIRNTTTKRALSTLYLTEIYKDIVSRFYRSQRTLKECVEFKKKAKAYEQYRIIVKGPWYLQLSRVHYFKDKTIRLTAPKSNANEHLYHQCRC